MSHQQTGDHEKIGYVESSIFSCDHIPIHGEQPRRTSPAGHGKPIGVSQGRDHGKPGRRRTSDGQQGGNDQISALSCSFLPFSAKEKIKQSKGKEIHADHEAHIGILIDTKCEHNKVKKRLILLHQQIKSDHQNGKQDGHVQHHISDSGPAHRSTSRREPPSGS